MPGRDRALRGRRLCRVAAVARDWYPHGPRRAARQQAVWTVARDVGVLVGVGTGAGLTLTAGGDSGAPGRRRPDARHLRVPPDRRSAGDADDRRLRGDGGARRCLRAGATRGDGGSAGGAAPRLSRVVARAWPTLKKATQRVYRSGSTRVLDHLAVNRREGGADGSGDTVHETVAGTRVREGRARCALSGGGRRALGRVLYPAPRVHAATPAAARVRERLAG